MPVHNLNLQMQRIHIKYKYTENKFFKTNISSLVLPWLETTEGSFAVFKQWKLPSTRLIEYDYIFSAENVLFL